MHPLSMCGGLRIGTAFSDDFGTLHVTYCSAVDVVLCKHHKSNLLSKDDPLTSSSKV